MRRREGFTLIEVLLAFVVMSTMLTALVVMVSQNVARLARAQERAEARDLAEDRARELLGGEVLPEIGIEEGVFDPPDDHLAWQLIVEPYTLPLPPGHEEQRKLSSLFAEPSTIPDAPQPSVMRAVVRVFPAEGDPAEAEPFVVFAVEPGGQALEDTEQAASGDERELP
jgi:type II secretory pathway pseudopilin PulG